MTTTTNGTTPYRAIPELTDAERLIIVQGQIGQLRIEVYTREAAILALPIGDSQIQELRTQLERLGATIAGYRRQEAELIGRLNHTTTSAAP